MAIPTIHSVMFMTRLITKNFKQSFPLILVHCKILSSDLVYYHNPHLLFLISKEKKENMSIRVLVHVLSVVGQHSLTLSPQEHAGESQEWMHFEFQSRQATCQEWAYF